MRRLVSILALLLALAVSAGAQPSLDVPSASPAATVADGRVLVSASADPRRAELGRTIVLTIDVAWPADVTVQLPQPESLDLAPFEVRDAVLTPQPSSDGRKVSRYTVRLASYDTGTLRIPPVRIPYKTASGASGTAESPAVDITIDRVASVPAPASPAPSSGATPEAAKLRDLKPMQDVPWPIWLYAAAVAAVLLLALLVGLAVRAIVRRARIRRGVSLPPHAVALEALDRLAAENLPAHGRLKEHYERLAEILRTYLAQRLAIPVLEHTTAEVMALMRDAGVDETLRVPVKAVLHEADMVKFARLNVAESQAHSQVAAVRAIIERTVAPPVAPPVAPHESLPAALQAPQPETSHGAQARRVDAVAAPPASPAGERREEG